jgi:hypothetical protein
VKDFYAAYKTIDYRFYLNISEMSFSCCYQTVRFSATPEEELILNGKQV